MDCDAAPGNPRASSVCDFGPRCYAGEPDFVPRGGAGASASGAETDADSDDGWLVGFVFDAASRRSFFAVVCAQTMRCVAALWLRHALPQGLHGAFYPGAAHPPPPLPAAAARCCAQSSGRAGAVGATADAALVSVIGAQQQQQ